VKEVGLIGHQWSSVPLEPDPLSYPGPLKVPTVRVSISYEGHSMLAESACGPPIPIAHCYARCRNATTVPRHADSDLGSGERMTTYHFSFSLHNFFFFHPRVFYPGHLHGYTFHIPPHPFHLRVVVIYFCSLSLTGILLL